MKKYIFNGKVLPEYAVVNIAVPYTITVDAVDANISFDCNVSIIASQISVIVKTETDDLDSLTGRVGDIVRNIVDAYGYLTGCGYDVEIISVIDEKGEHRVFGVCESEIGKTQSERPFSYSDLFNLLWKSQELGHAFGDLREAIRSPSDTAFHCYRAIESIRQHFRKEGDGDDKKQSWIRMKQTLLIDRSWIEMIEEFAESQRHGEMPFMTWENRVKVMKHAWKIIDRFCIYLHRNLESLPEDEFEVLKED